MWKGNVYYKSSWKGNTFPWYMRERKQWMKEENKSGRESMIQTLVKWNSALLFSPSRCVRGYMHVSKRDGRYEFACYIMSSSQLSTEDTVPRKRYASTVRRGEQCVDGGRNRRQVQRNTEIHERNNSLFLRLAKRCFKASTSACVREYISFQKNSRLYHTQTLHN